MVTEIEIKIVDGQEVVYYPEGHAGFAREILTALGLLKDACGEGSVIVSMSSQETIGGPTDHRIHIRTPKPKIQPISAGWSDATADIPANLIELCKKAKRETGYPITHIVAGNLVGKLAASVKAGELEKLWETAEVAPEPQDCEECGDPTEVCDLIPTANAYRVRKLCPECAKQ